MAEKLAIDGGPKAVTNKLVGWPTFDEKAIKAVEQVLRSGRVKCSNARPSWVNFNSDAVARPDLQPRAF